jgi:DNA invertase Pin-like site-specific DNA recombinase
MRHYCSQRRYVIHAVLPDTFTGTELDRPALNEARRLIRAEEIDVVVIYAYDRFFRNETHQTIVLHEARQHGVSVEAVTEQLDDSPTGRMVRTMLGLVAEIEHEKILERTMRGMRERVRSGKLKTGALPLYGYRWLVVRNGSRETRDAYALDEEAAPIVRWLFAETARGVSLRALAQQLNHRGVPTPSQLLRNRGELGGRPLSAKWHRAIIGRILVNSAYKGEMRAYRARHEDGFKTDKHTGRQRFVHTHSLRPDDETIALPATTCPAIVDTALWDTVQERLAWNKEEAARNNRDVLAALLRAGHVYCGHCRKRAATYFHKPSNQWKYRCGHGRSVVDGGRAGEACPANGFTHVAAPIDRAVWAAIESSLSGSSDGPSLLEQALAYRRTRRSEHEDVDAVTLTTLATLIEGVKQRRDNAQRALDNALTKVYDESTIEALTARLDEANRELRKREHERAKLEALAEARRYTDTQVSAAIEQLAEMGGRVQVADYTTKRRWLWLLGVRVYVYREGAYDDGAGNRWRVAYAWDGINALVASRLQQSQPEPSDG